MNSLEIYSQSMKNKFENLRMVMAVSSLKSDGIGPFYEGEDENGYHHAAKYAPNATSCADKGDTYRIRYNPKTGHVIEKRRAAKGDGRGGAYSSSFIGTVKEWEPAVERWL